MIEINNEKVLLLHQLLIQETGGDSDIRDINLLDSAIKNIYQTFEGKELYPTKEEKAAALGYSLINNHAFVDGNKRIGMLMMLSFLESNGLKVLFSEKEVEDIGMKLANGEMTKEELLEIIVKHRKE